MKPTETRGGRPRVLVVLGDGGHTAEILRLVELMGPECDYDYIATKEDGFSAQHIAIPGPLFRVARPRGKGESWPRAALFSLLCLVQAARICRRVRPAAVLGSGPSVMVPVALAARLLRSKVIFVETGSRITGLSLTGRIMLRLADLFFVQWEQLHQRHPKTVFAGRLL